MVFSLCAFASFVFLCVKKIKVNGVKNILLITSVFILPLEGQMLKPGTYTFQLQQGGFDRIYIVHIPPQASDRELPMVFMLHGAGGSALGSSERFGWKQKADKEGFIAVFPEGMPLYPRQPESFKTNPRVWTEGSGRKFLTLRHVDDMGYLLAVIEDMVSKSRVDKNKVFFTGFSNGASMAFRVGVEMSDKVAAIAPVSGHLWMKDPKPLRPISMLQIVGTKDPMNPLDGGTGYNPWNPKPEAKPSMQEAVNEWLKIIGASDKPSRIETKDHAQFIHYGPGTTGKEVLYIIIEGQGHEWPGVPRVLPENMTGPSVSSINATDVIWDFFKKQ